MPVVGAMRGLNGLKQPLTPSRSSATAPAAMNVRIVLMAVILLLRR